MNLLQAVQSLLDRNTELHPTGIAYIGNRTISHKDIGWSCHWNKFKELADFEYDPTEMSVAQDLVIIFHNGYEIYMWNNIPVLRYPFKFPNIQKSITTLKGLVVK